MILDIVGTALASMVTVIIAKTRCVTRFDCCTSAFNDPHVSLDTHNKEKEDESDEESIKTLPLPVYPYHTRPLPVHPDLRDLGLTRPS
jgi:hypothetical protein